MFLPTKLLPIWAYIKKRLTLQAVFCNFLSSFKSFEFKFQKIDLKWFALMTLPAPSVVASRIRSPATTVSGAIAEA